MLIKVLGPGCAKCKEAENVVNAAVQDAGSAATVEKVTDLKEMMALGVSFRQDVIGLSPEAVVIMAGTNDLAQNNGYIALENILGNIASMCELAKLHKIRPILCSVLPAYRFGWRQEVPAADRIIELNGMIERYARENGISYVDYHSALKDGRNGLPEKYSGDGVHPNPECYKIMEAIVLPVIDKKPAKKVAVRTGGAKKHS